MSDKADMARAKSITIPKLTIFLAFYLLTLSSSLPLPAIAQFQTHVTNSNNSQAQSQSYHLPSGQSNSQKNNTFQSNNSQSQSSNTQSNSSSPSGQAQQSHSPAKQTSSQAQSQTNQAQSQNNQITSSQTPSQAQSQAQLSGATLIMPMYRIRNPNGDIIIKFGQPQKSQEEEANGTTPPPPPPPQNNGTRNRAALSRVFLDHHNKLRAGLNQAPLVWDKKLTHYARRWAAQRAAKCDMNHSSGPFGENIFMGEPGRDWSAETAMQYWMDERVHYDAETNTCKAGEVCGHYTQMIWSRSEKLGCALVECANKGVFVQCNYDPPGNYEGDNPFQ